MTSAAGLAMLTIWRSFRIELPDEWEMLQFSREEDAGRCAFADRYQFRAEMSWRKVDGKPDMGRMMSDYRTKLMLQGGSPDADRGTRLAAAGSKAGAAARTASAVPSGSPGSDGGRPDVTTVKVASWQGVRVHAGGRLTTRFGRYFPGESCVVETVFLWPGGASGEGETEARGAPARDRRLEREVLESVRVEPERAGAFRRWRAFGMDVLASKSIRPTQVVAEPARARMTFGPEPSPGSGRNGSAARSGRGRLERFERLGLTSHWLRRSVGDWLKERVSGTALGESGPSGFVPDDGRAECVRRELSGHDVYALRGSRPAGGLSRLWGARVPCEAAAWVCPGDGRLYYVDICGPAGAAQAGAAADRGAKDATSASEAAALRPAQDGGTEPVEGAAAPASAVPLAGGRLSCCPALNGTVAKSARRDGGRRSRGECRAEGGARESSTEGSWRKMLLAVPVRNAAAEARSGGASGLRLSVKKRRLRFLVPPLSWVIKPRETRELSLDGLGAVVWDICGGERTVEEVVDEFARRHGLTFHEARVAVTGYMKALVERGALAMAVD